MSYADMARKVINDRGFDDWTVVDGSVLLCPCGHRIEYDGKCPNGHKSPLLQLGMI